MTFEIEVWTIEKLINHLDLNEIELKPPYQRNFIWTPSEQQELIESIQKNYPLPTFFLFLRQDGVFDMVDGQQRTRTIYRFINEHILDKKDRKYSGDEFPDFKQFKLSITVIKKLEQEDSLEIFYARVNKTGKRLNDAELNKAEYHYTIFLKLVDELTESQKFKNLDLFRDITVVRMNDRDFVEEIITLIYLEGFTDKKIARDRIYKNDITLEESKNLNYKFNFVLDKIVVLNELHPINRTRFRQKNDFYTLFSLIYFYPTVEIDTLKYLYQVLQIVAKGISPSNDKSEYLREYAIHCVSQSNSKNARERRYEILEKILFGKAPEPNIVQLDILGYYDTEFGLRDLHIIKVDDFYTFDLNTLKKTLEAG